MNNPPALELPVDRWAADGSAAKARPGPRLLLFGVTRLDEMLQKGNVWYVRYYEAYFEQVSVAYLYGWHAEPLTVGRTSLISLGSRKRFWIDFLCAPWRLWRLARRIRPTHYLTADIVFSWWTGLLLRWLGGARIVLMPTCIPNEVYANTGRSISGLPIWMERLLLRLSFAATERIVMTRNGEVSIAWLSGDRQTAPKLRIVPAVVEEFPSAEFYERLTALEPDTGIADRVPRLLYVGRLHRDKMVLGLIDMLAHLAGAGISVRLSIAGDGPERAAMQRRAEELKVADRIDWLGFVPNHELPALYRGSTLFVSTITGTALREAGLCGLPVVAYDADWVKKLLTHESTALLAPSGDSAELSRQVMRALGNGELRKTIGQNFHQMARERWSPEIVPEALRVMFGS